MGSLPKRTLLESRLDSQIEIAIQSEQGFDPVFWASPSIRLLPDYHQFLVRLTISVRHAHEERAAKSVHGSKLRADFLEIGSIELRKFVIESRRKAL